MRKLALLILVLMHSVCWSQSYPNRPVRIVVPFAAGSSTDVLARLLAEEFHTALGGSWVVENRAGAGGLIGAQVAATAPPDGYTLMLSSGATNSVPGGLFKVVPYDPITSFVHIGRAALYPWGLAVATSLPVSNAQEFVAYAKKNPGQLNFGYGSATSEVAARVLNQMAGINATAVSYKGQPAVINDLLAGNIQYMVGDIPLLLPHVKAQKLKLLGVTTLKPTSVVPDQPTLAATGIPGYQLVSWTGLAAPAGTPTAITKVLAATLEKALSRPAIRDRLVALGAEPSFIGGEPFHAWVVVQKDEWLKRLKDAGIEPQ